MPSFTISNCRSIKPRQYTLDNLVIPTVTSFSDLGVIIDCKLNFSDHITSITRKAYTKSILISRCFISKNSTLLATAFKIYTRPLLEYSVQVWNPLLQKDIDAVERVQRRFTKSIPSFKSIPYVSRLSRLQYGSYSKIGVFVLIFNIATLFFITSHPLNLHYFSLLVHIISLVVTHLC